MKHRFLYIYTAFIISISILLLLSFLFSQQLDSMFKYNGSVENTYKGLYDIQRLNTLLTKLESAARGYLLTGDSSYLTPYADHTVVIKAAIDTLKIRVGNARPMQNKVAMLNSTIKLRLGVLYQLVEMASSQDTSLQRETLSRSKSLMNELQTEMITLENDELKMLRENFEKKRFYENLTPSYLKIVLFFTCFIAIASFFFLNMSLRQRLRYQKELENKVDELHRSNEELEQLAHVASHDLQEPLRKLRTFSSRLLVKYSEALDDEVKLILNRIEASAVNMQELIHDVVDFTNLIDSSESSCKVDLNDVMALVLHDLKLDFDAKNVMFQQDVLPAIHGYPKQLYLLFKCLLENSLKFTRPDIVPLITLRVNKSTIKNRLFHQILVEDNGLGFDNAFNKKIFVLFQRLHGKQSEYDGKGIGLAIVKRIMINHKGMISANGKLGKGAIFEMYFPVV